MALTDGLISYWDLDDLTDKHGANDLDNNNGVSFVSDGGITVADFESSSDQSLSRDHADVSGFDSLSAITIAGFQKIEKLPNNSGDKNSWGLLSKFNSSVSGRGWLVRANDFDNDLEATFSGNSSFSAYSNTRTSSAFWSSGDIANWISIIVTYVASTGVINIYKNNVLVADGQSNVGSVSTIYNASTPLYIGIGNDNGSIRKWFDGKMKFVGAWDRALDSTERADYHNSGAGQAYADFSGGGGGVTLPVPQVLDLSRL
mgnify:CR=1 FL=1